MTETLLLTGFAPDSPSGGAVIVRSLVEQFPAGSLHWMTFAAPSAPLAEPFSGQFVGALPAPPARGNSRLGLASFWWWWKEFRTDPRAVHHLSNFIRDKQYRTVWLILDSPRAKIASMLVKSCPLVRFHFSIHDHPIHAAFREKLPPRLIDRIRGYVADLAHADCSMDAVTEELLEELGWDTPYRAVVTAGIDAKDSENRITAPSGHGILQVSCIGNYIGVAAVRSAISGLERWSASTARAWRMDIYGRSDDALRHPCVTMHPHIDLHANRREILSADLFLLPMGFEPNEIAQMLTCLPTKLVSYLEFGRIIVACAPEGSATQRIMRDYCLGPVVTDLDPRKTAKAVESALSWDVEAANRGRSELLADRFARERIFARFMRALRRESAN